MHYESLRLRIVEIEHDITKSSRSSAVAFKGTGRVDHHIQHKPSNLGRRSPPPPTQTYDEDTDSDDDDDDIAFDDEAEEGLSLERFPSAASQNPQPAPQPTRTEPEPPELEPDEDDYSDDDMEPRSPEEPTQEELQQAVKGEGNELYATYYEGVRKCVCHGHTDAPSFDRMWELPPDQANAKEGVTRAVAQISESPGAAQSVCSKEHLQQEVPVVA